MPRTTRKQQIIARILSDVEALLDEYFAKREKPRAASQKRKRKPVQRRAPDKAPDVLAQLIASGPLSVGQISEALRVDREKVKKQLRDLREAGAVKMTGVRRGAVWQVVGGKLKNGHAGARA